MKKNSQKVLVLGGTGSIGSALIAQLRKRGHSVSCLVRSNKAEMRIRQAGFDTIYGDIRTPQLWLSQVEQFDAVIPLAATWSDDMAEVDQRLMNLLIEALATPKREKTLLFTSGCWVYGNTGDVVADESSPHDGLKEFSGDSAMARRVQNSEKIRGMVILPAMVYERDGGVLEPMICGVEKDRTIRIVASEGTRWPLVHREDLAVLYCLMLECAAPGAVYNGAAIVGMEVGKIADVMARRLELTRPAQILTVEQAVQEMGSWARGYALDQQMSGAKAMRELGWVPRHTDILGELA